MSPMVSHLDLGWLAYSEWAGKNNKKMRLHSAGSEFREAEMRPLRATEQNQSPTQRHWGDTDRYQGELIARDNQPLLCRKGKSALPSTLNCLVEVSLQ